MEDESFDLEAGVSLDRPDENHDQIDETNETNSENNSNNNGHSSRVQTKDFELERIDKLVEQSKVKQIFKLTIVQQPTVSTNNCTHITLALSLLGSPEISFNPLDYIVLSTNLINVNMIEEFNKLSGQTALVVRENNPNMKLDLTVDDTPPPGEYRLTLNMYRVIIIGDTSVKLICGTLNSKTFQLDTSRAKPQPSTFASLGNFSSAPQLIQKFTSIHQLLVPVKYNSAEELKKKANTSHLWYGGLIWPRLGDLEQHYIELYISSTNTSVPAEDRIRNLPALLDPKTVTLDEHVTFDQPSFECQIHSPRITSEELVNAFRYKATHQFWCFVVEFAACKMWIQPRLVASGVRVMCSMKINEGHDYIQHALAEQPAMEPQDLVASEVDSDELTEKGEDVVEEVSSGSEHERPHKRRKVHGGHEELQSRRTTPTAKRRSWCDASAPCEYCLAFASGFLVYKRDCLLMPQALRTKRRRTNQCK